MDQKQVRILSRVWSEDWAHLSQDGDRWRTTKKAGNICAR
jgi:hypothetical protein